MNCKNINKLLLSSSFIKKISNGRLFDIYHNINQNNGFNNWRYLGEYGDCGNFAIALNKLFNKDGRYWATMCLSGTDYSDGDSFAHHIILKLGDYLIDSKRYFLDTFENRDIFRTDVIKSMTKYDYEYYMNELEYKGLDIDCLSEKELLHYINPDFINIKEIDIFDIVPMTSDERVNSLYNLMINENQSNYIDIEILIADEKTFPNHEEINR